MNRQAYGVANWRFMPTLIGTRNNLRFSQFGSYNVAVNGELYTVKGWVEYIDEDGDQQHKNYHCTLRHDPVKHGWTEVEAKFDPAK